MISLLRLGFLNSRGECPKPAYQSHTPSNFEAEENPPGAHQISFFLKADNGLLKFPSLCS
jgi:hypothetical protein